MGGSHETRLFLYAEGNIMKYHPYSEMWPLMDGENFEKLKADIAANGLHMNVITYNSMVLDGRNRERACEAVGVTVRYADAGVSTDDEALKLVVSLNEHRRHLSYDQRAFAAARMKNIINGSNRFAKKIIGPSLLGPIIIKSNNYAVSTPIAAKAWNVTHGATEAASAILHYVGEEGATEVISGKTALWTKRNAVLADPNRPKRKSPTPKPPKRAAPGRPRKYEERQKPVLAVNNDQPVHSKLLSREQVDPEFRGTALEFAAKYGHVNQHTAEEYATMRFDDLASDMKALAKRCREFPERKAVDSDWLRNPNPRSVAQLMEALDYLRPKIAEAEALLERAVTALKEKK